MSFTMRLGHKSYSGGNLTVAVSPATTGAGCATHRLHSERHRRSRRTRQTAR